MRGGILMNELISVIVPVYNIATYLPMCIESILSQKYSKLEIILIDDGSTDESGKICDEYAKRDCRITVIHQDNKGAAAAKNAGLRVASGYYLSFVDSDDYLELDTYDYMIQSLQENEADIVQCSYRDVYKDFTVEHILEKATMNQIEFLTLFTEDWTCALLWDKLYKRSLFDGIYFETGHKIDDEYFTYYGVMNARKIIREDHIVYNYRKRISSVMYSPASVRQIITDRIDFLSKRRRNVIESFPQLRAVYDIHYLNMMIILSRNKNITEEQIGLIRIYIKEYFHEREHTKPDYRLLPSLAKLMLFKIKTDANQREDHSIDKMDSFFE